MPLTYSEAKALVDTEEKSYWLAQNTNRIDCKVLGLSEESKSAKVSIQFDDANQAIVLIREYDIGLIHSFDKTKFLLDPMCLPMMLTEPKPERKRRTKSK